MTTDARDIEVSVIIPAGRDRIEKCLNALLSQTISAHRYEIFVVSDKPIQFPDTERITFVKVSATDPATKRNTGAKRAHGSILAFIDDDAWAGSDWLETGLRYLTDHPEATGVGGPLLVPPDAGFREKASDVIAHSKFFGNGHGNWPEMTPRDKTPHGVINTCNCFIRKTAFETLGGFNETIGLGGEDTEFFFRASHQKNYKFAYTWKLVVYHPPRKIGLALFTQRYRNRVQNGRMLWVHPSIYLSRATFSIGVFGITLFLLGSAIWPIVFPIGLGLYFILALSETVPYARYDWRFLFVLPPVFFIHHSVYYFAIMKGFFSIVTDFKRISQLRAASRYYRERLL